MASFWQLLTAQQSVNTQGIENNLYKINALLSSTDNQTRTISSLQELISENSSDIDYLGTLTQHHTTQLDSIDDDLFALKGRVDEEVHNIVSLQSLTKSHTSQINPTDDDLFAIKSRLDTEEPKIISLQSMMASHTEQINLNDDDLLALKSNWIRKNLK
jgi:chromosome segregation ATPase